MTAAPIHKGRDNKDASWYKQTLSDNENAGFPLYGMKDAANRLKDSNVDPARIPWPQRTTWPWWSRSPPHRVVAHVSAEDREEATTSQKSDEGEDELGRA